MADHQCPKCWNTSYRAVNLRATLGKNLGAVVGVVVAKGYCIDYAIQPTPLRALVLVRPGQRTPVDGVPTAENQGIGIVGKLLQIGNCSRNTGGVGLSFGIKRHGVRVVIRKMQQSDGCANKGATAHKRINIMMTNQVIFFIQFSLF